MAIACGLALVVVAIIIVLRVRPRMSGNVSRRGGGSLGGLGGQDSSTRRNGGTINNHNHYLASHVHLPLSQTSCGARSGDCLDECINLEEKDPDVIPSNKGNMITYVCTCHCVFICNARKLTCRISYGHRNFPGHHVLFICTYYHKYFLYLLHI